MDKGYSRTTLVELLVVIGIIGVLVSLTMSAVQRARAAAVRARCVNNLRQIGIGVQQYHLTHSRLPPGVSHQGGNDPHPFMNWHTRLLPYLDQQALWDRTLAAYKLEPSFLKDPPHVGHSTPLAIFGCPSDSRTRNAHTFPSGNIVALTSYLGVEGTNSFWQDGLLFLDSNTRLTDASDGTSQTLLVGERPPSADCVLGWWYAGWGQDMDGEGDGVLGAQTKNKGRNGPKCPIGPYSYAPGDLSNQCDAFHFWSLHAGGGHFLFADGSVQFLSYSAASILPALATRAGGEPVAVP